MPQALAPPCIPRFTACLGGKQLAKQFDEACCEQIWRTCCLGNIFLCLDEVTSRVNEATKVHELVPLGDTVISLVAIGHQRSAFLHAGEQLVGQLCPTTRRIGIATDRDSRACHLTPQVTLRLWLAPFLLEHLEGRLVCEDHRCLEQRVAHQVDHGLRCEADLDHACSDRVRRDIAAEAAKQASLAIQRHAKLELSRRDPGKRGFGQ